MAEQQNRSAGGHLKQASPRRTRRTPQARPSARGGRQGSALLIVVAVVALVLGGVLGGLVDRFLLGTNIGGSLGGKIVLSEGDLSAIVATYRYDGKSVQLSAREVLEEQGRLETAARGDGTYDVPTADDVLAVARGRIIAAEAERLGITVGEQDVQAYAQATLGSSSIATLAAGLGMSEQAAHAQLEQAALMQHLRAQVVSEARPEAPALPPTPEEGEEVVALQKYGAYIAALAGSEWDATADTWASDDSDFASALAGHQVSASSATYDEALIAYWVAYQRFVAADASAAALWTDYVNGLLSQANIAISTLAL